MFVEDKQKTGSLTRLSNDARSRSRREHKAQRTHASHINHKSQVLMYEKKQISVEIERVPAKKINYEFGMPGVVVGEGES